MRSTMLNFFSALGKPVAVGTAKPLPVDIGAVGALTVNATIVGPNPLPTLPAGPNYELVPQNSVNQVLGGTGAVGDRLDYLVFMPAIVGCGSATINDNATLVALFGGGATSALVDLKPFYIPIFTRSLNGPWKVTTGASIAVLAIGAFT